jgi:hypothetical protein
MVSLHQLAGMDSGIEEVEEAAAVGTGSGGASTWCFGDFLGSFGAVVGMMKTLDGAQPSFILSQPLPLPISAIDSNQRQSSKNGNLNDWGQSKLK